MNATRIFELSSLLRMNDITHNAPRFWGAVVSSSRTSSFRNQDCNVTDLKALHVPELGHIPSILVSRLNRNRKSICDILSW